jgi:hypothetical protein
MIAPIIPTVGPSIVLQLGPLQDHLKTFYCWTTNTTNLVDCCNSDSRGDTLPAVFSQSIQGSFELFRRHSILVTVNSIRV